MIATPSGSRDRPDRALCEAYAAARMGPLRRVVFWAGTGGTAYRIDSRWQRDRARTKQHPRRYSGLISQSRVAEIPA